MRDDLPSFAISRHIYGDNEIGAMDGGPLSSEIDAHVGVTARRLGGDLMTTYNWMNNAANAGKDYRHANGAFLLETLKIPRDDWTKPGIVIAAMHEASLTMGATSLVTLPLQGYVAADFAGVVSPAEAAPSPRFIPVTWGSDAGGCNIPQLLRRLVDTYGGAGSPRGIAAYALDNEPGLWAQTHPRVQREPPTIRSLIEKSLAAARAIKAIDPAAKVFGPASWGATEMVGFQNAPDWADYRRHGSFLAAYLDAFREASELDGRRLLDALDVHWYAFHRNGDLYRGEKPELDEAKLSAPRSLDEEGFREDSWVSRALPAGADPGLPILPSLKRLVAGEFRGTEIAITEFNYGGAGSLASGLALADALGRFGRSGVAFAAHWGALGGWLGEACRLYRARGGFGDEGLAVEIQGGPEISAFAAREAKEVRLVVINKAETAIAVDIAFAARPARAPREAFGFDAEHVQAWVVAADASLVDGVVRVVLPARSARRFAL